MSLRPRSTQSCACRNRSSAVAALCAAFALVSASCASGDPGAATAGEIHVSHVGKDTVSTFLNRLATETGQVVVTRASVDDAWQSVALKEERGTSLYLVAARSALAIARVRAVADLLVAALAELRR